jgi:hypothetical protein
MTPSAERIKKYWKNKLIAKKCVVCNKPFLRRKKKGSTKLAVRPVNCLTCSKKCARDNLNKRYSNGTK